jgi:tRNA A58 N-methylase Trm61
MRFIRSIRVWLYDAAIVRLTADWYRSVLTRLPPQSRLLDIGIGTGSALLANASLVTEKDLHVTGVDVDAAYVDHCRRQIERSGLSQRIEVRLESIYDHGGGPYAAAYFSGSFMLLPDPGAALAHVLTLLEPAGRIYFTQTFEHRRSHAVEILKPLLRRVTTIDFGRVTYEVQFQHVLAAAGLEVEIREVLHAGERRSSVLVAARLRLRP